MSRRNITTLHFKKNKLYNISAFFSSTNKNEREKRQREMADWVQFSREFQVPSFAFFFSSFSYFINLPLLVIKGPPIFNLPVDFMALFEGKKQLHVAILVVIYYKELLITILLVWTPFYIPILSACSSNNISSQRHSWLQNAFSPLQMPNIYIYIC